VSCGIFDRIRVIVEMIGRVDASNASVVAEGRANRRATGFNHIDSEKCDRRRISEGGI
jgi:hypothetical protein